MAQSIREVMTPDPVVVEMTATLVEAAGLMADHDIGALVVQEGERVRGILTDRDIVVRAVARGLDPAETAVFAAVSEDLAAAAPDDPVDEVVTLMRTRALRRIPVVEGTRAVGIVSIGDLARERDPDSALADISAAPPNR